MRKSLKQIVSDIEAWTLSHYSLKSFGFGDMDTLFKSENHTYPKLWLVDTAAGLTGDSYQAEIKFKLWVMDIQNSSNELDVLSDSLQTCYDFLTEFIDNEDTYIWSVLSDTVTLEPFREVMNDTLTGYSIDFSVNCGGALICEP